MKRKQNLIRLWGLLLGAAIVLLAAGCQQPEEQLCAKPVIYLYPTQETEVEVNLALEGTLTASYPDYREGWHMVASPDGTLTDPDTGREYYCLFWEGTSRAEYDLSRGFVVPGAETAAFLEDTLDTLGLNQREADEFIIYWLPRMEENPYNLITFQTRAYTDTAVLEVDPRPDTVIRVFMAWKGLEEPVAVEAQPLEPAPERRGFTLVEWGGTEVH